LNFRVLCVAPRISIIETNTFGVSLASIGTSMVGAFPSSCTRMVRRIRASRSIVISASPEIGVFTEQPGGLAGQVFCLVGDEIHLRRVAVIPRELLLAGDVETEAPSAPRGRLDLSPSRAAGIGRLCRS
jgi:hypothetical protein